MTPQWQTPHDPDNGIWGNCFACCIATILDKPISEVPHFADKENPNWLQDTKDYLAQFGLNYFELTFQDREHEKHLDFHYILSGPSPRFDGIYHCVVAKAGVIVHDPASPFPDENSVKAGQWYYGLIVKL